MTDRWEAEKYRPGGPVGVSVDPVAVYLDDWEAGQMRHTVSRGLRPGQPETPALETLALLIVLFVVGLLGWVVFGVLVYLVIVYTLVTLTVLVIGFVTTAALWLSIRGNWRARALAAGLMVGALGFVAWVWTL